MNHYITASIFALVVLASTPAEAAEPVGPPPESENPIDTTELQTDWWTPWYLVDYGLIAAGGTGFVVGEMLTPRFDALIGPGYDPDDPTDLFVSSAVDEPYLEEGVGETIPTRWVEMTMIGVGAGIAGLEAVTWATGQGTAHQFHNSLIGFAEATALTAATTSLTKPFVGRLRPDFGDRALRYHCEVEPEQYDEYCDGYRDMPLGEDRAASKELLLDGRRSFFSGHASHSFNTFSYASLVVGGHFVWGDEATTASRIGGIGAQTAMMGMAGFIAGSRITDGRHHTADVVAGSLVGLGIANLSYWRRFGLDGNARLRGDRDRSFDVQLHPAQRGTGLAVTVRH